MTAEENNNPSDSTNGSDEPNDASGPDKVNEPGGQYQPREPLSFEKVWQMFQESKNQLLDTERIMKAQWRESDKKFRETREQMLESFKETDRKWQETDKRFQETAGLISELREEYKNRWGELVESLVSGNLLRILKERDIPVHKVRQHVRNYKGEPNYELDLVASNGDEVVVVEVKSVLNPEAVKHFTSQLNLVRNSSRRFRKQQMIGAVAFLKDYCDAATMAMKRGLLAIRATSDSAVILNDKDFEPHRF